MNFVFWFSVFSLLLYLSWQGLRQLCIWMIGNPRLDLGGWAPWVFGIAMGKWPKRMKNIGDV